MGWGVGRSVAVHASGGTLGYMYTLQPTAGDLATHHEFTLCAMDGAAGGPVGTRAAAGTAAGICDVRAAGAGAIGDNKTDDTRAIQSTIDACRKPGC